MRSYTSSRRRSNKHYEISSCAFCGKRIVTDGRRKTCSDKCRVALSRKNRRNSPQTVTENRGRGIKPLGKCNKKPHHSKERPKASGVMSVQGWICAECSLLVNNGNWRDNVKEMDEHYKREHPKAQEWLWTPYYGTPFNKLSREMIIEITSEYLKNS